MKIIQEFIRKYRSWLAIFIGALTITIACDEAGEEEMTTDDTTETTGSTTDDKTTDDTSDTSTDTTTPVADNDISILKDLFYSGDVEFVVNETTIQITSKDLPDHKSVYYDQNDDRYKDLYENYTAADDPEFMKINNLISEQNIVMTIPRFPVEATNHESTGMGAIGIAINSVAFYNQFAAGGASVDSEIKTFDQYEGHAQMQGQYHYHTEPVWLTVAGENINADEERFLGLLLDGFPVYGPVEGGTRITNENLDPYHGHTSATKEFPNGIYHYHITDDSPYINGNGYFGTPGTK